jgi:thymidylate synthase (FAD)
MYEGRAVIIQKNEDALSVVASAARISTTEGSALALFSTPQDAEKNLKLIKKVLASGHKSLMEHQTFSVAFDRVSVLVEQFMIEHRLASFIMKSRRYVDFVERQLDVEVCLIGTGASRERVLSPRGLETVLS